ncbi:Putative FACT complex subunit spt16 [Rhizopus microsporus]|nr:Putative FACT complex subunit spt16 [Rhizopus microsporus]
MADVVEQGTLNLVKGRKPLRLSDVYVRPLTESKRLPGELEIHQNGLKYQSIRSDSSFNVLFSNIKHLFFQPCDNELLVLIHIHFKNPILIGKKKTKDIQFYREASDIQYDETGNKRRRHMYGDEDEIESEQEERRRRAQLNREFKQFAEKIAEASDGAIELDVPFRELGFQGVPFRSNVLLQPTTDCLVHLSDPPFLCITLSEVELVHLERVQFGLKNFDMVFIFKDFNRAPVHINTIPMSQLDNVKDWLDSVEVAFTEGSVNLNWSMIMKTINDDPAEFFRNGEAMQIDKNANLERQKMQQLENMGNHDLCDACGGVGQFLCCDACPNAFHFSCVEPPMDSTDVEQLTGKWFCNECEYKQGKPIPKGPKGLFKQLVEDISIQNPKSYKLPDEIIDFFQGGTSISDNL